MNSNGISRRFLLLGGAALGLSGCSNAVGQDAPSRLDARVDATRNYLLQNYPAVAPLVQGARGVLYMSDDRGRLWRGRRLWSGRAAHQ